MDKRVEVHGSSRAELNGKCGVATDFHLVDVNVRGSWRYTVEFDDGETAGAAEAKVHPANLRAAAEPEPVARKATKEKKKKKGKKGRGKT